MINASTLLAPVFVEVALTFGLLIWAGALRVQAVRAGVVQARDVSLRQIAWPPNVQKVSNAYQSQLELPLLFYLVILLTLTQLAPIPATILVLAWIFVILRLGHALVHVTTNDLTRRFFLFLAGALILLVMWLIFLVRIYIGA